MSLQDLFRHYLVAKVFSLRVKLYVVFGSRFGYILALCFYHVIC